MKFKKKPIMIEAMQFTVETIDTVTKWCAADLRIRKTKGQYYCTFLKSPSGNSYQNFDFGEWIIKGVKGEFYVCCDDIFMATYEAVTDDDPIGEFDRGFKDGHEVGFDRGLREKIE